VVAVVAIVVVVVVVVGGGGGGGLLTRGDEVRRSEGHLFAHNIIEVGTELPPPTCSILSPNATLHSSTAGLLVMYLFDFLHIFYRLLLTNHLCVLGLMTSSCGRRQRTGLITITGTFVVVEVIVVVLGIVVVVVVVEVPVEEAAAEMKMGVEVLWRKIMIFTCRSNRFASWTF